MRAEEARPGRTDPEGQRGHGGDDAGEHEAVDPGEARPDPARQQDVRGPARRRAEPERHPGRVEAVEPAPPDRDHPRGGQDHPGDVAPAAGQDDRQHERPDELDRDRRALRQPVEGGVERRVHHGEHEAEGHGQPERAAVGSPARLGRRPATAMPLPTTPAQHQEQDEGGPDQTEGDDAHRAHPGEQPDREAGPELDGQDRGGDRPDRRGPRGGRTCGRTHGAPP